MAKRFHSVRRGVKHGHLTVTTFEPRKPNRRGDIRTEALYMDKGVVFDGKCVMGQVLELDAPLGPGRSADDTSPDGYKDQPNRS